MNEDSFHLGIKALIRNKKGEILLLQTNPKELKGYDGEPYWDIPGGRIHRESTVEKTLKREVAEETGITNIKRLKPLSMVLSNVRIPISENESVGLILSVYICEVEGDFEIKLSDEHIAYNWFSPKEAADLLKVKYPREFTERIRELE
ncbi:NUDIX domain-containing protein [Candidatus Dojkabacteria bacterium]|nr:NUDIX domain-containing protein [Candidatus Dojkabacteria bacterium]